MSKVRVGVAGYGVIGQRLADGVALQGETGRKSLAWQINTLK